MEDAILATARTAARAAGDIALRHFTRATISEKATNNLVTQADLEAEEAIIRIIHAEFPDHLVLGEEGAHDVGLTSERLWIIDPLDGTNNYAHANPHFSVSIAYAEKGDVKAGVVFDPIRGELFSALPEKGAYCNDKKIIAATTPDLPHALIVTGFYYDRGALMERTLEALQSLLKKSNIQDIRRTGSAALDLCWVACGRFDAYFEYKLSPWDYAAGMLIAREAGAEVLDRTGTAAKLDSTGVLCANPLLMPSFLDAVKWKAVT